MHLLRFGDMTVVKKVDFGNKPRSAFPVTLPGRGNPRRPNSASGSARESTRANSRALRTRSCHHPDEARLKASTGWGCLATSAAGAALQAPVSADKILLLRPYVLHSVLTGTVKAICPPLQAGQTRS